VELNVFYLSKMMQYKGMVS